MHGKIQGLLVFHQPYSSTFSSFIVVILFPVKCILCIWQYFTYVSWSDNDWICGTWSEHKAFRNFKVDQKRMKCAQLIHLTDWQSKLVTYYTTDDRYTTDSRPIFHRQSMVKRIGRHISVDVSTDVHDRSRYRSSVGRYVDRYIDRGVHLQTNV